VLRKEFKVHDKGVILITGTSTGIGRHAVFELAASGHVVFAAVRNEKDAKSIKDEAVQRSLKDNVRTVILDVTKDDEVNSAHKEITDYLLQTGLPMMGLVNNAGISLRVPCELIDLDEARRIFDINFFGVISVTKKFTPLIRKDHGRIIFVSSVLGFMSLYGSSLYSSTKHAMEGYVDAFRLEMLPFGVSVTSVLPGFIQSAIADKGFPTVNKSSEAYKLYEIYIEKLSAKRKESFTIAGSPQLTSDAIKQALVDPYPKTRYAVGPVNKLLNADVALILAGILPDRLVDLLK